MLGDPKIEVRFGTEVKTFTGARSKPNALQLHERKTGRVPGVFAAGGVRHGSTKQVTRAAGEGAAAAILVREYLKTV